MSEKPILFTAPMVRALLAGTKTQTRRVAKLNASGRVALGGRNWHCEDPDARLACPYGQPGDQLFVKETFFAFGRWETRYNAKKKRDEWHFIDMTLECGHSYSYPATDSHPLPMRGRRDAGVTPGWWKRPAIFMPRAASRITLEITGARVERLQDISEADARAEGIADGGCLNCGCPEPCGCTSPSPDARDAYIRLWEQINGAGSWAANPWVWVVEFKRVKP